MHEHYGTRHSSSQWWVFVVLCLNKCWNSVSHISWEYIWKRWSCRGEEKCPGCSEIHLEWLIYMTDHLGGRGCIITGRCRAPLKPTWKSPLFLGDGLHFTLAGINADPSGACKDLPKWTGLDIFLLLIFWFFAGKLFMFTFCVFLCYG